MRTERLERHFLFFVAVFLMTAACAASVPLAAQATALPDLIVLPGVSPTSGPVGVPIRFSVIVKNQGTAGTGSTYPVRFQKADDMNGTGAAWIGMMASETATGAGVSKTATMDVGYAPPSASTFYVRACANVTQNGNFSIAESDTTNNCGVWTAVNPLPNVSFSVSPDSIPPNGTARLSWFATEAFSCTGTNFSTGGSVSSFVDVSPASDTTYSISCTNSVGAATPPKDVTVTLLHPDLIASVVTPSGANAGTPTVFSSTISNINQVVGTGGSFFDVLQKATDSNGSDLTSLATYQNAPLPLAGTGQASFSYAFPLSDSGTVRYLRVCADKSSQADSGLITESNESNNCSPSWTATSVSPPPVNLRPTIGNGLVTVLTSVPLAGQPTNLSASFSNYGTAASGPFPDLFEAYPGTVPPSTFAEITGNGGVAQIASSGLGANGASTITGSYTFPYAGNWLVRACADTDTLNNADTTEFYGAVPESSETDNCGGWRSLVVNTPWAILSANGQSSVTVLKGDPVLLSWLSGFATSCTGTNFSTGGSTANSVTVNPTADTTYSIRCDNGTSPPGVSSAQVHVVTIDLSLSASPQRVRRGGQTTLTWSVSISDLTSNTCNIQDQDGTTIANFGVSTNPTNGSTATGVSGVSTYTLSCTAGPGLNLTTSVVVKVVPDYREF